MVERRRGFGYIRKLPSGRYQASYLGPDQVRHNAPITFEAKIDCEGWLATERRLIERDEWIAPAERAGIEAAAQRAAAETVRTYAERWLAEGVSRGRLRPLTALDYRRSLELHILPTLGDVRLSEVTRGTVRAWHDTTMANTAPRARSKAYALLRTVMNNAVQDELIAASPVQIRGAGVARRKHEIEPASLSELDAIVAAMPERLGLTVLLATWCALRYGEVAELRRKDVTLSSGQLRVARSVSFLPGGTQVGPPKTKAGARRVAVPPHVLPALERHLKAFVKSDANALLFPGEAGGHLHESVLFKHWDRARRSVGRADLRFHDLRHTGATLAAQAGATTAELQARLGHATPDAAMIYQHAARGRDQELAARLSLLAIRTEAE
ncbi:site-specific integrase [Propioniciclava tarda]|uniref:Site-specific integrase n=1 Tax=Propioniciclava tarda TaxID=433330 RepID=A0A4Q9KI75_PROTD|nr:site-specific integrase [Propioniciclava tarda]SMO77745.1 Site-specific recombinase XerD [Propioniciclava tarda]